MSNRKHIPSFIFILAMIVILNPAAANAQERTDAKLAQTGMKFLTVGVSARQAALADAFTAAEGNEVSMFYNPAGMARLDGIADVSVGRVSWIADIKYQYAAVAFSPWSGDLGVFGLSFQYADYGEIQQTILATNKQGYLDIGTLKPNALAVGLGYARALTDKFSIGGNVKYVRQDLGTGISAVTYATDVTGTTSGILDSGKVETKNALDVVAFDFGILYRTGFKSLTLGMAVRNFSREVKYQKESFQLPLTFRIGVSMNVFDLTGFARESQALNITVDAEHPRDFPEQVKIGAEYVFMNMVSARVGYIGPADEHSISYGLGFQLAMAGTQLGLDYAYTPFGIFNNVQRFSLRFGF
jgi:hypothetical protein